MYSLDSSGLAHMSAPCQIEPSSIHGMRSGAGYPKHSPRYRYSSPARCFTRPSRFVPVGVSGRRRSYSLRSSSLDSTTARLAWSLRCSSALRSGTAPSSQAAGPSGTVLMVRARNLGLLTVVPPQLPTIDALSQEPQKEPARMADNARPPFRADHVGSLL